MVFSIWCVINLLMAKGLLACGLENYVLMFN
jgi:hypothetical protein